MNNFFKLAVMALILFVGGISEMVAQEPPPPPPICVAQLSVSEVDNDDAFARDGSYQDQVHFIITTNGQYRKYYTSNCFSSWNYDTLLSYGDNGFYAQRQSYYTNSDYTQISEYLDWD